MLRHAFDLAQENYNDFFWMVYEVLPVYIFIFQILLDLNTSYYSKGIYITARDKIMKHYLKFNFGIDLITLPPLFFCSSQLEFLEFFVMIRMVHIGNLVKSLENFLQLKGKLEGCFQLLKLFLKLIFIAHICACAWHFLGMTEVSRGIPDNWIVARGISDNSWQIRYIVSFYFSIVTMMTVGYGDISSVNHIECCLNIVLIIFGCGVFAYTINDIGFILKEMYQEDKEFKLISFLRIIKFRKGRRLKP